MWLIFAIGSAFFAGLTSVLAKRGIKTTDSDVATAIRTIVVLIFSCLIVLISGVGEQLFTLDTKTVVFLVLSGAATGASWICYFRALQYGNVNKVVPIDKSSTVLTIILAFIFLGESVSPLKAVAVLVIALGIFLMIEKKDIVRQKEREKGRWLLYAVGSAFFASLTTILGKIGIEGVDSNLGTTIRTVVVLIMAWGIVFASKKEGLVKKIPRGELLFICLSGVATGASWLCYYRALQDGPASVVAPIDKLSILVTVVFSYFMFGERLSKKGAAGLALLVIGTVAMAML